MTDNWATPDWLWGCFPDFYDPCPPNPQGLRVSDGFGTPDDWITEIEQNGFEGLKLNPPHSAPLDWVLKGIAVAAKGKRVVMLLRLDSTTEYHNALIEAGFHPFGAFERIAYGSAASGGRYANVLWFSPTAPPTPAGQGVKRE